MIEVMTTVANLRGIDEMRVANDYTHRQVIHVAGVHVKDKFMVVTEIAKVLTGKGSVGVAEPEMKKETPEGRRPRTRAPSWYKYEKHRPRGRIGKRFRQPKVIDLDGPMEKLAPFLGKTKIKKGGAIRLKGKRKKK